MKTTLRAFTLIELLIVVAIIAILAAIAVPNFLEAQTRAKVSRVRADVRTVATAMETYKIDNNKYPPMAEYPFPSLTGPWPSLHGQFSSRTPSWLTTPVSHMTSLPNDIFVPNQFKAPQEHWNRYIYFNYEEISRMTPGVVTWKGRNEQTGGYFFYSFGPDKNDNQGAGTMPGLQGTYTRYDASNGTVSRGNIIRTAASPEGFVPYNAAVTGSQNGPN